MFKYIITDLFDGAVKGTNSDQIALDRSQCEDYFVVRVEDQKWLYGGKEEEIQEIEQ